MPDGDQIAEFDDKQLWLVEEPGWCLPVYATPYTSDGMNHTHWVIRPAKQLLAAPHSKLQDRFHRDNLGKSHTSWVVEADVLPKLARKAPGVTPEFYLKWEDGSGKNESVEVEEIIASDEGDTFINFVCSRSAIDLRLARYFWRELKAGLLEWLIQKQKSVDFELFELHPVPYRSNWKEIMLARHPLSPKYFAGNTDEIDERLVRTGFVSDLGSADLASMKRHPTIFRWTLEVEPKPLWLQSMEEAESARSEAKRPVAYAKYYESALRRGLRRFVRLYRAYIKEVCHAVGTISESAAFGEPVLVPRAKRTEVLARRTGGNAVNFQPSCSFPVLKKGPEKPVPLEKKIKEMRALHHLRPEIEDVRDGDEQAEVGG